MSKIFLTGITDEGEKKSISFKLIDVYTTEKNIRIMFYAEPENKLAGFIDIELNTFNDFCLDIFNEHKRLMK